VPTRNECVTFNLKTGNQCVRKQIDVAAVLHVSKPMARALSIRQLGESR
jgi:hypothetical protein